MLAGKGGLAVSLFATLILALIGWNLFDGRAPEGQAGICLPSPNEWHLSSGLSFTLNLLLSWICCLGAVSLNKRFNFIPGSGVLFASVFLWASMSIPWIDTRLTSSFILAAIVLLCCHLLFTVYGKRTASQEIFIIFSILSWGSMIQYSCLLLMPVFMLGAIFLKAFHLREFIAAILAAFTPYWIVFGTGLLPMDALHEPGLTNFFTNFNTTRELMTLIGICGALAAGFIILLIANSLRFSSLGVKMRAYNSFLNLLGVAMIWFMLFDSSNMTAYIATLALAFGFQAGRFFLTCRIRRAYLIVLLIPAIAIALFITSFS